VGTASVAYQHTNFSGPSARESDWYGSLGVSYSLSTRTGLYGTYSHLTRNSTIQSGDLEENLFVIGVRRYF
jgi:predicted porin